MPGPPCTQYLDAYEPESLSFNRLDRCNGRSGMNDSYFCGLGGIEWFIMSMYYCYRPIAQHKTESNDSLPI